jgi:hypothetical protein
MNEHMSRLSRRALGCGSEKMADDWHAYGGRATFIMKVVEMLPVGIELSDRRAAELRWMRHYANLGKLYNAHMISFGPGPNALPRGHTPEVNEKRRLTQLGKPKRAGHGAKISATKRALGQRPSLETARRGGIAACQKRYGHL